MTEATTTPSTTTTTTAKGSRPGGRSARTRRAVLDAAVDELVDRGYEALSLSSISRRAAVDRVTLYRRWGSVAAILADALGDGPSAAAVPDTGSFRGDIRALMIGAVRALDTPRARALTSALNASTADELARMRASVWRERQEVIAELIRRAVVRGETGAPLFPVERIADVLFGSSQFRLVVRGARPTPADIEHLADLMNLLVTGTKPPPADAV